MKQFNIYGDIVPDGFKMNETDVCLQDFQTFLDGVEDGEEIEIQICSCGGDVFQGIAISNLIKQYQKVHKCHFKAHVISIAASIASVIASACDEIVMDSNALFMIHLPYTCDITGNALDLAKEIEQLNICKESLIAFYLTKFDLTADEIESLLERETWIDAKHIDLYKLNATVNDDGEEYRFAAKLVDTIKTRFNNKAILERICNMNKKAEEVKTEEVEKVEETKTEELPTETITTEPKENAEVEEEKVEEAKEEVKEEVEEKKEEETKEDPEEKVEEKVEEVKEEIVEEKTEEKQEEEMKPSYEELLKENEELKKVVEELKKETEEPTDKRVSGMQSKMQNKINDLTKEFQNRLDKSEKELSEYKSQITSLKDKLDETEKTRVELQDSVSALKNELTQKTTAMATLNARVNTPTEVKKEIDFKTNPKGYLNWIDEQRRSK